MIQNYVFTVSCPCVTCQCILKGILIGRCRRDIYSSPLSATYMPANWVIIASDNGLSPIWHQAIILTNTGLLSVGPQGTNFSAILIKIQNFSFTKMHLKKKHLEDGGYFAEGEMT